MRMMLVMIYDDADEGENDKVDKQTDSDQSDNDEGENDKVDKQTKDNKQTGGSKQINSVDVDLFGGGHQLKKNCY